MSDRSKYDGSRTLVVLPCDHRFHTACLKRWAARHTTCPCCRKEVTQEALGHLPPAATAVPDADSTPAKELAHTPRQEAAVIKLRRALRTGALGRFRASPSGHARVVPNLAS